MGNYSIQQKTIEWETRDLFKKISDTKGTFHAKMGTIKERNGIDLTEAEYINKKQMKTTELENQRSLQENQRYQGNISCKDGDNKRQK